MIKHKDKWAYLAYQSLGSDGGQSWYWCPGCGNVKLVSTDEDNHRSTVIFKRGTARVKSGALLER